MTSRVNTVNEIMLSIDPNWRYRWCENKVCGCMGAVNCSARSSNHKEYDGGWVTNEEWKEWVSNNPQTDDGYDKYKSLLPESLLHPFCK